MLVGLGQCGVLPGSADDVTDLVGVRVGRPRVSEPSGPDDPDADAPRLGELQTLDLAAELLPLTVPEVRRLIWRLVWARAPDLAAGPVAPAPPPPAARPPLPPATPDRLA